MTHLPHTRDDVSSVRRTWLAAGLLALPLVLCTPPVWAQPRPVLHYNSEITLTATPQRAWDTFKTFGAIHDWHPATEGARLLVGRNGQPLAVREFRIKGGDAFVISELLSYDEARRHFRYRIIKTNLPLSNYVAEMWVTPGRKGGSVVHWSARFQRPEDGATPAGDDAATQQLVQGVFKAGLDNIAVLTAR
jgi:mxaD protein